MAELSRGERVQRALVALFDEPSKPKGLTVHRNPGVPIPSDDLPALVLMWVPGEEEEVTRLDHGGALQRRLPLRAEIRAGSADTELLNDQVDEIYVWTVTQVAKDRTLGGLTFDIEEVASTREVAQADETYIARGVHLSVTYLTDADDPTEGVT